MIIFPETFRAIVKTQPPPPPFHRTEKTCFACMHSWRCFWTYVCIPCRWITRLTSFVDTYSSYRYKYLASLIRVAVAHSIKNEVSRFRVLLDFHHLPVYFALFSFYYTANNSNNTVSPMRDYFCFLVTSYHCQTAVVAIKSSLFYFNHFFSYELVCLYPFTLFSRSSLILFLRYFC